MGKKASYDFSGWAATTNVECTDHTIIRPGAFAHQDGHDVTMVWQHNHGDISNVLGHAILKDRGEKGTYMYGFLNKDTEQGRNAKAMIEHGDIKGISIYANQLQRRGKEILHGDIKEVSLVLATADPGAYIDYVAHSENGQIVHCSAEQAEGACIFNNAQLMLAHSDEEEDDMGDYYDDDEDELYHADDDGDEGESGGGEETVGDIVNSMNEKQATVLKALVGKAYEKGRAEAGGKASNQEDNDDDEGDEKMKHDVFDSNDMRTGAALSHSDLNELCRAAFEDTRNYGGSFHDAFVAHADQDYGIGNIDLLFPDAKAINNTPEFIKRETEWVAGVMSGTKHVPYTRIKSLFADITADEARARGYIKGNKKIEEFFALAKRETTPQTIYKKQKLDRDDILDVTTIDVVNWLWSEMRLMLNEELARAFLIGDGRTVGTQDKISEDHIRPIVSDAELFMVAEALTSAASENAATMVEEISKKHKNYKGTGSPTFFTTVDQHTNMLWIKDLNGRRIYESDEQLCSALRVSKIVEVPVMESFTKTFSGRTDIADGTYTLAGIKVNLSDYAVGTDKGGEINSFDDFDIDYNQYKYLLETRCSGCLVKYHAAQTFWLPSATAASSTDEDAEG